MTRRWIALFVAFLAMGLAGGCGEEEPEDNAVEAQETNVVVIDALRYRVILFRQLNPNVPPDDALYEGPPTRQGNGIYAAFVQVCNDGSEPQTTTGDVHLEDAFGERFPPQPDRVPDKLEYQSVELDPGECLPPRNSAAEKTYDGAALIFEVPFNSIRERPIILELQGEDGAEPQRIQLDV